MAAGFEHATTGLNPGSPHASLHAQSNRVKRVRIHILKSPRDTGVEIEYKEKRACRVSVAPPHLSASRRVEARKANSKLSLSKSPITNDCSSFVLPLCSPVDQAPL